MSDEKEAKPIEAIAEPAIEKGDQNLKGAIQKISEKRPEFFQEIMMGMGSVGHPLIHKLNEEHVTKVLDLMVQHDRNQFELTKSTNETDAQSGKSFRWFVFWTFVILVGLTVFVLVFFKDKPETLTAILSGMGGLIAGGLGGYGIGKQQRE